MRTRHKLDNVTLRIYFIHRMNGPSSSGWGSLNLTVRQIVLGLYLLKIWM